MGFQFNIKPKVKYARNALFSFALLSFGILGVNCANIENAFAQNGKKPTEYYLGNPNAKVVLLEYGSMTCSHCGHFAREIYPKIHEKYVATGKVRYVFRTMPTPPIDLAIAMQLAADCAGSQRYQLIEEYFNQQPAIFEAAKSAYGPINMISRIAKSKTGIDKDTLEMCFNNQEMRNNISNLANFGEKTYKITGTPSFVINGKYMGPEDLKDYSFEAFSQKFDALLNTPTKPQTTAKPKVNKKK
jgi:protein-disulfide isomerase